MTKVLLIRHGHVEGIKSERFRGRADLELTGRGHREAQAVAGIIATGWRAKAIYASPLKRCVATATAISEACAVPWRVLHEPSASTTANGN